MSNGSGNPLLLNFTFILNGSDLVRQKEPPPSQGITSAAVALILLFMVAFTLNAVLVVTIASSYLLKRTPFNLALMSLGCAHIVECILNMIVSLVFIEHKRWGMGTPFCSVNSFFMHVVSYFITLQVLHMLLDRVVAIKWTIYYRRRISAFSQSCIICLCWLLAVLLPLPIAIEALSSRPFPSRYACFPADVEAITFNILFPVLAYIIPFHFSCAAAIYILWGLIRDSLANRSTTNKMTAVQSNQWFRQPLLWAEVPLAKLALLIFALYIVLHLPQIVNVTVDSATVNHTFYIRIQKINKTNVTTTLPEVYDSPSRDTAFAWCRYVEAALYPLVVYLLRRDLRAKSHILLTFWKSHSTTDMSPRPSAYVKRSEGYQQGRTRIRRKSLWPRKKSKPKKDLAHYSTPVLFATSEGLYLRVTEGTDMRASSGRMLVESGPWTSTSFSENPEFICHVCDVWESYDDIEDLEEYCSCGEDCSCSSDEDEKTQEEKDVQLKRTLDVGGVFSYVHTAVKCQPPRGKMLRRFSAGDRNRVEPLKVRREKSAPPVKYQPDTSDKSESGGSDSGLAESDVGGKSSSSLETELGDSSSSLSDSQSQRRKSVRFSEAITEIPQELMLLERPRTVSRLPPINEVEQWDPPRTPPPFAVSPRPQTAPGNTVFELDRIVTPEPTPLLPEPKLEPKPESFLPSPPSSPPPTSTKRFKKNPRRPRVRPVGGISLGGGDMSKDHRTGRIRKKRYQTKHKPAWNGSTKVTGVGVKRKK